MSDTNQNSDTQSSARKSTLKILSEVDKEILKDNPPNFSSQNYIRVHNNQEGKLHG